MITHIGLCECCGYAYQYQIKVVDDHKWEMRVKLCEKCLNKKQENNLTKS